MEKKSPSHPTLVGLPGGKNTSTPAPSPRPPIPSGYPQDIATLVRALSEAQGRAAIAETHNQSLLLENAELRGENGSLKAQAKLLISSDISHAAKRIIRAQLEEIREGRIALMDAKDQAEADRAELEALKSEYQKLLESYELSLSAEDLLKMLKAENAELQSAQSVRDTLMEELAELKIKLEKTDKLMLSDLSPSGYRTIMDMLSSISFNWLQSDDAKKQADGFKLQTTILQQWSDRRTN